LRPVQTLWLGPDHHLVHYPIAGGEVVNIVAIGLDPARGSGDQAWHTQTWTAEAQVADILREYAGWDARVLDLIRSATDTKRWALYDHEPLPQWTRGRVGLLGDAAHAMLPFFAQGAAQAVEDAAVLATCLRGVGHQAWPDALRRYERLRKPRATQVQEMSRGREVRNHLHDGPEQQARDAELASSQPLRQSAWLYGHDALADTA
jgi:salicylate hydroxylase